VHHSRYRILPGPFIRGVFRDKISAEDGLKPWFVAMRVVVEPFLSNDGECMETQVYDRVKSIQERLIQLRDSL
jgi:hypothetical protein